MKYDPLYIYSNFEFFILKLDSRNETKLKQRYISILKLSEKLIIINWGVKHKHHNDIMLTWT